VKQSAMKVAALGESFSKITEKPDPLDGNK
jgi:hypothetical protein